MSVPRTDGSPEANASGQQPNGASNNGSIGSDTAGTSGTTASPESDGPGSDWLREAFMGRVGLRATSAEDTANGGGTEPVAQTESGVKSTESVTEPSGITDPPPFRVFRSEDEFRRVVQSEKDKEIARERNRAKTEEEQRLLRDHPHEYARVKREELEENERLQSLENNPVVAKRISDFATEQIGVYDSGLLDPLVSRVADSAEKAAILGNIEPGVEGRAKLGTAMLGLWEKQIRSEARRAFAEDPAFIKEILVRHGGQRAEPEVVSAVGAAPRREDRSQDDVMNEVLTFGRRGR